MLCMDVAERSANAVLTPRPLHAHLSSYREILGAVIVENAAMKVTRQFIMDNRTARGSWTRPQIEALGIEWPPTQGWMDRVIGLELTPEQAHQFKASNVPRNKAAAVNKDQLGLF